MDNHEISNKECPDCWNGYPVPCKCGGLVHAQFGDENSDGDYWLEKFCDICGSDYQVLEEPEIEHGKLVEKGSHPHL